MKIKIDTTVNYFELLPLITIAYKARIVYLGWLKLIISIKY